MREGRRAELESPLQTELNVLRGFDKHTKPDSGIFYQNRRHGPYTRRIQNLLILQEGCGAYGAAQELPGRESGDILSNHAVSTPVGLQEAQKSPGLSVA